MEKKTGRSALSSRCGEYDPGPGLACVTLSGAPPQFVESNVFRVITSARQWKDAEEGSVALGAAPGPPAILGADGAVHPSYSLSTGSGLSEASILRIMGQLLSGLSFMVGGEEQPPTTSSVRVTVDDPCLLQHRHGFFHRDL